MKDPAGFLRFRVLSAKASQRSDLPKDGGQGRFLVFRGIKGTGAMGDQHCIRMDGVRCHADCPTDGFGQTGGGAAAETQEEMLEKHT